MKLNYKKTRPIADIDYEVQSAFPLQRGLRAYATHPSTKALTCVVGTPDGMVHRFGPYIDDAAKTKLTNIAEVHTLAAHNATFDAAIHEITLGLPEAEWLDTLPQARAAGLPGGLDKLSKALGGRGKDKNGARLIDMLCILKPGKPVPVVGPAHKLLMDYNVQDVEELKYIRERVDGFGEPDVIEVDRVINSRGIPVDRKLLGALVDMYDENSRKYGDEFKEFTADPDRLEGLNPRSPKQLQDWLHQRGVFLVDPSGKPSLGKPTVQKFLSDPETFTGNQDIGELDAVREMLELRRELAGVGRGKVDKALELVEPDDRIREQFVYFGAHTGRFSSRGLQLHNMPSALKVSVDMRTVEPTYAEVSRLAEETSVRTKTHVTVSDCLNIMLRRAILFGPENEGIVIDYGAVEARCLAWLCGDEGMLSVYADPKRSLYLEMGDVVFQRRINKKEEQLEYVLCKALVLGCGYGMSGAKFRAQCAIRESREFMAMLDRANIDLAECVKTYRKTYPRVPELWNEMGKAAIDAVKGTPSFAGRCELTMVGPDLHLVLPSGRPIVYRNARIEPLVPAYCKMYNMPEVAVPTVTFDNPRGFRGFLYGAKIVENACQAICRDLLVDAVVKCESVGLPVVLHVHDEIACAGPAKRMKEMCEIMTLPPSWADGFPVLVEAYAGPQWTKNHEGYQEMVMLSGRVV